MGTQIHAGDNYRRVVELVQSGAIGPVREVHVWVSRAWGWHATEAEAMRAQGHRLRAGTPDRSRSGTRRPRLGSVARPGRAAPVQHRLLPGPKWYRWWDFGNGTMSDLGSHWIDLPFWALKLEAPSTIEANGPPPHPEIAPASMQVTYEYKASRRPAASCVAHLVPGHEQTGRLDQGRDPAVGRAACCSSATAGMLLSDYGKHAAAAGGEVRGLHASSRSRFPTSIGHYAEWIARVQDRHRRRPATSSTPAG